MCARICARDASGQVEIAEMQQTGHEHRPPVRPGQHARRLCKTPETVVVRLITQRSARLPPASAVDGPQLVEVLALGGLESVPVVPV
jgi:hypothetical protein